MVYDAVMGAGHPETGTPSGTASGTVRASDRSEVYTVQEAAKILGITERRVRALAHAPSLRKGGLRECERKAVGSYSGILCIPSGMKEGIENAS